MIDHYWSVHVKRRRVVDNGHIVTEEISMRYDFYHEVDARNFARRCSNTAPKLSVIVDELPTCLFTEDSIPFVSAFKLFEM